jgi:hypothetical protein
MFRGRAATVSSNLAAFTGKTNASPSTPHPCDEDLSPGTPDSGEKRFAQDDNFFIKPIFGVGHEPRNPLKFV